MAKVEPETTQPTPRYNNFFKYVALFTMPIEGIFFFGLINGWPNLAELLKVQGVYESACANSNISNMTDSGVINCNERDELFSAAGTLGSIVMNCMTFPLGMIFDRYGSLIARSICTTLMSIGLIFLMFTVEVNWFMYPGIMFLASGSFALLVTNHPLSQLFPKAAAFIVVVGQCVFQGSNSVFRLWGLLFESGVPFKAICALNLSFTAVHWVRTFFLMPLAWVKQEIAPYYQSPFYRRSLWPTAEIEAKRQKRLGVELDVSPKQIIFSLEFMLFLAWVCVGNLDAIYTIFTWSQFSRYVQQDYTELVDLFGSLLWSGAIYSVVSGLLIDFISIRMKRPIMDGKVIIVGWLVVFEIVCGIIMHGLQYHLTESSSMGVVIIFNCYRALLYSLSSVYIRCNYPIQVFGTLNGALRITMGITSLANFGLTRLVSLHGELGYMSIILTFSILIFLTTAFPIKLLYTKLNKN